MGGLRRPGAAGGQLESTVELRQIFRLDDDVELAETGRAEAQLAPGQPPAGDGPLLLQQPEPVAQPVGELQIADPGLQIAPDLIEVHRVAYRRRDALVVQGTRPAGSASFPAA